MLVPKEILSGSGERLRYLLNPSRYHRGHVTCWNGMGFSEQLETLTLVNTLYHLEQSRVLRDLPFNVDITWNKCLLKWILPEPGEKIITLVDIIWARLLVVVVGAFLGGWRDLFFFCINFITSVHIMIFLSTKPLLKNCSFVIGGL